MVSPAQRLNQFIDEGRIVRGKEHGLWRGTDEHGRETATLLAAFVEEVSDARKFPAEIMPGWLTYFTSRFNNCGSDDLWPEMIQRFGAAALGWGVLDEAAWRRSLANTMIAALGLVEELDTTATVFAVRTLWMRVADRGEPSDQEWHKAASTALAEWAMLTGLRTDGKEPTAGEIIARKMRSVPLEARAVWVARFAAELGPISAEQSEATAVAQFALEAWQMKQPQTASEAAASAQGALAAVEQRQHKVWNTVAELIWTVGPLTALLAAWGGFWVLALVLAAATASLGALSSRRSRDAKIRAEDATAASTSWWLKAYDEDDQQMRDGWDYITDLCLRSIEREISKAR